MKSTLPPCPEPPPPAPCSDLVAFPTGLRPEQRSGIRKWRQPQGQLRANGSGHVCNLCGFDPTAFRSLPNRSGVVDRRLAGRFHELGVFQSDQNRLSGLSGCERCCTDNSLLGLLSNPNLSFKSLLCAQGQVFSRGFVLAGTSLGDQVSFWMAAIA